MDYIELQQANPDGSFQNQIIFIHPDGRETNFDADNDNPTYLAFLAALEKENPNDPHFVAWVEAGNNPEDFWTQENDII